MSNGVTVKPNGRESKPDAGAKKWVENQDILLTGATGAVGPAIAAELLAGGAARTLRAMIRPAGDTLNSDERFSRWSRDVTALYHNRTMREIDPGARLQCVPGDVSRENLGLTDSQRDTLSEQVEVIVHAAADTRFRVPAEVQWDINVEGTRRVLEFAARCRRLRKLILVSTVCVSGVRSGLIEESFCPKPAAFVNGYERTKWEAERLAMAWSVPLEIARLSIVMGSARTGSVLRPGAFHHVLRWFALGVMPNVPGYGNTLVDLISTEMAAAVLAKAALSPLRDRAVWHIAAGDQAPTVDEIARFVSRMLGEESPMKAGRGFAADNADARRSQAVFVRASESLKSFLPVLMHPRVYQTTNAQQLWGGPLPVDDWREMLPRVMDFFRLRNQPERSNQAIPARRSA